jgi:ATP-dependent helicase HrpA
MTEQDKIDQLIGQLEWVSGRDRARLRRRLAGLGRRVARGLPVDRGLLEIATEMASLSAARQARDAGSCVLSFDPALPISHEVDAIRKALEDNQVIIVAGETGSGKTTQLPKICLQAGLGKDGWIGCTQPRRLAARTIAARLAEELKVKLGGPVGYQVRFDQRVGPDSLIKVMTDGILLAETRHDRLLEQYDTLIIDEAHERSLNIDFILGYLRRILPKRPDLKIIITSATIDTERFAQHFDGAPVIEVSGRTYPVEMRYQSQQGDPGNGKTRDLPQAISDAVSELSRIDPGGDILVFLPGERDIHEARDFLGYQKFRNTEVLPLYGRLSSAEQNRIFHPGPQRRIILATNVAETSLTVPRIRFVIDSGLARVSRYSHRSKVQRLPIEAISQASANQRAGRCGRLGPGVCIRLYEEEDFQQRPEYTEPEILRTNLAAVILQMESLSLGELAEFPFLDRPEQRMIADGYQLLFELGALGGDRRMTEIGRGLVHWPLDVRLARLILAGRQHECLSEAVVIAAALSIQDPRERPLDKQQQADQAQAEWSDNRSDFLAWIKFWDAWCEARKTLSNRQQRNWCRDHFLNYMRMREWSDINRQLIESVKENKWRLNSDAAGYESLHKALLSAFLGHIGLKDENEYLGARQRRFSLFPGSGLFKSKPQWVISAFLVETTRVYARTNARVDPMWAEKAAGHLVKRRYFDPYWSKRAGRVLGYEQVTLYGLPLVQRRRIHYGPHDPELARELFIREALVNGHLNSKGRFLRQNRALIDSLEELEHKQRRRDILVDEQILYLWFDQRIPPSMHNAVEFEVWRKQAELEDPELLVLTEADLVADAEYAVCDQDFPDTMSICGVDLNLNYALSPGKQDDGISLQVPLHLLGSLRPESLQELVPGMRHEKVTALIKSLPKPIRRNFVPAPDFARDFLAQYEPGQDSLVTALARWLSITSGLTLGSNEFDESRLADHLRFNIHVSDGDQIVASGRDLQELQQQWADEARQEFLTQAGDTYYRDNLLHWPEFALPDRVELETGVEVYPALVDQGDAAGIRLFERASEAQDHHRLGVRRLLELTQKDKVRYLGKSMDLDHTMCLQYAPVDRCENLRKDLVFAVSWSLVADFSAEIRDLHQFEVLGREFRRQLLPRANEMLALLRSLLNGYHAVRMALLDETTKTQYPDAVEDMNAQLGFLLYPGFLTEVSAVQLKHYPRYLEGLLLRIERLRQDPGRDARRQELLQGFSDAYFARTEALDGYPAELDEFHWLLEEYRVSVFAQPLKTALPVSPKRLKSAWRKVPEPS